LILTGLGLLQFLVVPTLQPQLMNGLLGAALLQLGLNALFLGRGLQTGGRRARNPAFDRLSTAIS
jgi:cadmium resistance protein CadD (predicted permease)